MVLTKQDFVFKSFNSVGGSDHLSEKFIFVLL